MAPRSNTFRASRAHAAIGIAIAAVAIAAWQACSIYDTSLLLGAVDGGADAKPRDASPGADVVDAGSDADTCAHAHPPAPPAADDPSPNQEIVFIDALLSIDIGLTDAGPPPLYSFDLDGVCTCPGASSCITAATSRKPCDDQGGRDNAGGTLLREFQSLHAFDQPGLNARMAAGLSSFLIRVEHYNGTPNDTHVTVSVYSSDGMAGTEDGGTPGRLNDGTDKWTINPAWLLNGASRLGDDCNGNSACVPFYVDSNAYVTNNVLVSSLDFPLSLDFGPNIGVVLLSLTGTSVVATLSPTTTDAGAFRINQGQIAGRWAASKALPSLAALKDPLSPGQNLCGNDATYLGVKQKICATADITSSSQNDNTNAACDALSLGVGFTATPAMFGQAFAKPEPPAGCADDSGAPFTDTCP